MLVSSARNLPRDRSYIRGEEGVGGGLVQTWGGPLSFMQAQKRGSNNLVHVIKGWGGGALFFFTKLLGSRSQSRIPL